MKLNNLPLFLLLFFWQQVQAQMPKNSENSNSNSEAYYLFPIMPGQVNTLAGTMGELRTTHFHMGLDIRTNGTTGIPVLSAADGYISRVSIRTNGYGKAIYVKHPNGETTVYAHLQNLEGPIALHVRNHQYIKKTFNVNLFFKPNQFKVSKGDTIALSGNSGSSGGPHLHFEIRDKNANVLNPLKYQFSEIKDHRDPVVKQVAFTTLEKEAKINGKLGRVHYNVLQKNGNQYYLKDTVYALGTIGIETFAYDLLNFANFKCGITKIKMTDNGKPVFQQRIEKLSFYNQRSIYAHYNYWVYKSSGVKFNKLYIDQGNYLKIFDPTINGKLNIKLGETHVIKVEFYDSYDNKAELHLTLKGADKLLTSPESTLPINGQYGIHMDQLVIPSGNEDANEKLPHTAFYSGRKSRYWGIDLDKTNIEKINRDSTLGVTIEHKIPVNQDYTYYEENKSIFFPKNALFKPIYIKKEETSEKDRFTIGNPNTTPLRRSIQVSYRPDSSYNRKHAAVYKLEKDYPIYMGGTWKNDKIKFKTTSMGTFTILEDNTAPTVRPILQTKSVVRYKIKDNLSGIKHFSMTIDGAWVLLNYDYKTGTLTSEKLNKSKPFSGAVVLLVTDNANNTKTYTSQIK